MLVVQWRAAAKARAKNGAPKPNWTDGRRDERPRERGGEGGYMHLYRVVG